MFFGTAQCRLLGLTGNAIPIARGCLATLKVHDFRASIGLTTVCIGLGWVTVNLIGFIFDPTGVILFSVVLQAIVTIFIKVFYKFSEKAQNNNKNIFKTVYKSYKWCVSMLLVAGGTAAMCAYLFTETSFYQIYTLDELSNTPDGKKVIGLLMGFAYLTGVIAQWITNPSDKNSIKFGSIFSFTFLVMFYALNYIENLGYIFLKEIDSLKIYGIIQFLFAFGFGLFVPALFSLMSKKVHPNHIGRLFGAVDTADTGALGLSWFFLYLQDKDKINKTALYSIMLILFLFSLILFHKFTKVFKSYEKD